MDLKNSRLIQLNINFSSFSGAHKRNMHSSSSFFIDVRFLLQKRFQELKRKPQNDGKPKYYEHYHLEMPILLQI